VVVVDRSYLAQNGEWVIAGLDFRLAATCHPSLPPRLYLWPYLWVETIVYVVGSSGVISFQSIEVMLQL
jgi:hypothetical protein